MADSFKTANRSIGVRIRAAFGPNQEGLLARRPHTGTCIPGQHFAWRRPSPRLPTRGVVHDPPPHLEQLAPCKSVPHRLHAFPAGSWFGGTYGTAAHIVTPSWIGTHAAPSDLPPSRQRGRPCTRPHDADEHAAGLAEVALRAPRRVAAGPVVRLVW